MDRNQARWGGTAGGFVGMGGGWVVREKENHYPKEKTPEFTKMGEIHELFVFSLSFVWFAGATPE